MTQTAQPVSQSLTYDAWKAEAASYAWSAYCLPNDCIEDDIYRPMYDAAATPQEAVDEHCEDCDIQKVGPWNTI